MAGIAVNREESEAEAQLAGLALATLTYAASELAEMGPSAVRPGLQRAVRNLKEAAVAAEDWAEHVAGAATAEAASRSGAGNAGPTSGPGVALAVLRALRRCNLLEGQVNAHL